MPSPVMAEPSFARRDGSSPRSMRWSVPRIGTGRCARESGRELRDRDAASLEENEHVAPSLGPERAILDEREAVVDVMLRARAEFALHAHEAIGAAGRERLFGDGFDCGERIEAIAAVRDGLAVPSRVDERVAPGEKRLRGAE